MVCQNKTTCFGQMLEDILGLKSWSKKLVKYVGIFVANARCSLPAKCRIILYNAFIHSGLNYDVKNGILYILLNVS